MQRGCTFLFTERPPTVTRSELCPFPLILSKSVRIYSQTFLSSSMAQPLRPYGSQTEFVTANIYDLTNWFFQISDLTNWFFAKLRFAPTSFAKSLRKVCEPFVTESVWCTNRVCAPNRFACFSQIKDSPDSVCFATA